MARLSVSQEVALQLSEGTVVSEGWPLTGVSIPKLPHVAFGRRPVYRDAHDPYSEREKEGEGDRWTSSYTLILAVTSCRFRHILLFRSESLGQPTC